MDLEAVADRLYGLPGVRAVALGGSRAQGVHRRDSDWDLGLYYRGTFDPQTLRDLGWRGQVFELGEWGGGIFNGGAWLEIEGSRVDVIYRDLESVEHELAEAQAGRFRIEPLLFHLAGIPSYVVVAELAVNRPLRGELPRLDGYPDALRAAAPARWWEMAALNLFYARDHHAPAGRLVECAGLLAVAAAQTAHAVLAARGEWVLNEKSLLERAGLRSLDPLLGELRVEPEALRTVMVRALALCEAAVEEAVNAAGAVSSQAASHSPPTPAARAAQRCRA
jgi:hypothetical protein